MRKILLLTSFILLFCIYSHAQISDCSDCGKSLLTERDIKDKSLEELSLLRNEIFARNGYIFNNTRYDRYFSSQGWYNPVKNNTDVKLSGIENQNIEFLKKHENQIQKRRDIALSDLKILKTALNENNATIVNKFFKKLKETDPYATPDLLKKILNKLDLNQIHWNKGRGYYGVRIDNGYCITLYSVYFDNETITVNISDPMSHSEIFGDFDDGYSDYMSESEHSASFVFKMTDNGITLEYCQMAG
ncbi:MAG: YARHG domain-containing protein [Dysgonomonas sp.]|nr:YARHG domain-containing protein [Dysgonomonas sp.]